MKGRDLGLDAFRGLAVLGMAVTLFAPALSKSGLDWTDFIFPFLLFALGASIPLSLHKRLPEREPETFDEANLSVGLWLGAYLHVVVRALIFAGLAFAVGSLSALAAGKDEESQWLSICFFASAALVLLRLNSESPLALVINCVGAAGLAAGMLFFGSIDRVDPFLAAIALNSAVGAVSWMLARNSRTLRLILVGAWLIVTVAETKPGWLQQFLDVRWIADIQPFDLLKWQMAVLPGVAVGEALLAQKPDEVDKHFVAISALGLAGAAGVAALIWFKHFEFALVASLLVGGNAIWLSEGTNLLRAIQSWGWGMMVVGLVCEPLEGVRPAQLSLSYVLLSAGMATMGLGMCEALRRFARIGQVKVSEEAMRNLALDPRLFSTNPRSQVGIFALIGQNPLVAYLAAVLFAGPALHLSGLSKLVRTAEVDALVGVVVCAGIAAGLSAMRLRLRA